MEMTELILTYILGPAVTILLTWFVARKQSFAEAKKTFADAKIDELTSVEKAIGIWRKVAEELELKLTVITEQNTKLLDKVSKLETDYKNLLRSYNDLKRNLKN